MVTALDKRVDFKMFVKGMVNRVQGIMAKTMPAEEKLTLIIEEMKKDAEDKRVTARAIRAKMVALSDPDTAALEPLERLKAQREKLVKAGKAAFATNDLDGQNRIAQDIKSIDVSLNSMESTFQTLKESYEVAIESYKVAQAALDHTNRNGSTLLLAIKAQQEALKVRDNSRRDTKAADTSFLNDLEDELTKSQSELRSDVQIDRDLNLVPKEYVNNNQDILDEFKS